MPSGVDETPTDAPKPLPPSRPTWTEGLRELVTAGLSVSIAVVALWMLVDTYVGGRDVIQVASDGKANQQVLEAYGRPDTR